MAIDPLAPLEEHQRKIFGLERLLGRMRAAVRDGRRNHAGQPLGVALPFVMLQEKRPVFARSQGVEFGVGESEDDAGGGPGVLPDFGVGKGAPPPTVGFCASCFLVGIEAI